MWSSLNDSGIELVSNAGSSSSASDSWLAQVRTMFLCDDCFLLLIFCIIATS